MATLGALRFGTVALSLLLLWRVIQVNAVWYEDTGQPRLPTASSAAAGGSEREMLFGMIRDNPAQVAALLVLARDNEREGKATEAARAYAAAYQLAPDDREVLGATAEFRLRNGNVAEGVALLGRLAENYPQTRDRVFPVLAEILVSRQHPRAWDAVAAQGQDWIGPFVLASCNRGVDPAMLAPLHSKRIASGKVTAQETACLVDHLRSAGRWEEAYQVWLNSLSRERLADVGFVFNGGFEYAPSGIGFDWMPTKRPEREVGHTVEIAATLGAVGKRALRVSYNGKRQAGVPITQFLALAPGRYMLSAMGRSDGLKAGRGVQWTVRCVRGDKLEAPLAVSERFVGSSEWRRFSLELDIARTCPGQVLQLESAGADEGITYLAGTVWFDDLVLRRIG
jgi:hypothetical protein